jgi:hypothetical protein
MKSKPQLQTTSKIILLLLIEIVIPSLALLNDNSLSTTQNRGLQGVLPHGISDCSASFIEASLNTHIRTPASLSLFEHHVQTYCANGGFCKALYRDDPYNPCQCLEGFSGPHCEFVGSDVAQGMSCSLKCQNDGVCRIGADTWENLIQYNYDYIPQEQRQYCSCPNEYYGTLCEHGIQDSTNIEICGDRPCLNGGICKAVVGEDGTTSRQCDCSETKILGVQHAGQYCEHNATDVCAAETYGGQVFCVNGGICKSEAYVSINFYLCIRDSFVMLLDILKSNILTIFPSRLL